MPNTGPNRFDNPDVGSDAFATLNPLRRIPVLVLDDGSAIPESETIVEYLEDAYPSTPLRPDDPRERARVRLIARVAELYLFPAALPIFGALRARDQQELGRSFFELDQALGRVAAFLSAGRDWHAFGGRLSTADGALAPFSFYAQFLGQSSGRAPLAAHPRLLQFWEGAQHEPAIAEVTEQMAQAFRAYR